MRDAVLAVVKRLSRAIGIVAVVLGAVQIAVTLARTVAQHTFAVEAVNGIARNGSFTAPPAQLLRGNRGGGSGCDPLGRIGGRVAGLCGRRVG